MLNSVSHFRIFYIDYFRKAFRYNIFYSKKNPSNIEHTLFKQNFVRQSQNDMDGVKKNYMKSNYVSVLRYIYTGALA